jgi:hypothetical protein
LIFSWLGLADYYLLECDTVQSLGSLDIPPKHGDFSTRLPSVTSQKLVLYMLSHRQVISNELPIPYH